MALFHLGRRRKRDPLRAEKIGRVRGLGQNSGVDEPIEGVVECIVDRSPRRRIPIGRQALDLITESLSGLRCLRCAVDPNPFLRAAIASATPRYAYVDPASMTRGDSWSAGGPLFLFP